MTKNAEVLLTINLEGAHKPWFVKDRNTGKPVRIFNPDVNHNSECVRVLHLKNAFVLNAIEDRPESISKYQWAKMSNEDRVRVHLYHLCLSLDGRTFNYKVVEAESSSF